MSAASVFAAREETWSDAEMSDSGASVSNTKRKRSIALLGSKSSRSAGKSDWASLEDRVDDSVSWRGRRCSEAQQHWACVSFFVVSREFVRTFPGVLRCRVAKGAYLTSTFKVALGLKGASRRPG